MHCRRRRARSRTAGRARRTVSRASARGQGARLAAAAATVSPSSAAFRRASNPVPRCSLDARAKQRRSPRAWRAPRAAAAASDSPSSVGRTLVAKLGARAFSPCNTAITSRCRLTSGRGMPVWLPSIRRTTEMLEVVGGGSGSWAISVLSASMPAIARRRERAACSASSVRLRRRCAPRSGAMSRDVSAALRAAAPRTIAAARLRRNARTNRARLLGEPTRGTRVGLRSSSVIVLGGHVHGIVLVRRAATFSAARVSRCEYDSAQSSSTSPSESSQSSRGGGSAAVVARARHVRIGPWCGSGR